MSETCHPGIAYILQLYTEEQSRVDTALTHSVCHTSKEDGMRGMELPYQLRSDWMVTCVLFLCFILGSHIFSLHRSKAASSEPGLTDLCKYAR